jgi:hypothetical protein
MAQVLKLRRNGVDTSLINTSGWHVVDPGWVPKVGEAVEGRAAAPVEESVRIAANFADQDALAAALISLGKLAQDAARYGVDRHEEHPVWFHDKLDDETGERRALVRKISLRALTEQHGVGDEQGTMIEAHPVYELGIEREPYWERTSYVQMPLASPSAAASLTYDYTTGIGADVVGDSPARVGYFILYNGMGSGTLDRVWIGLRSANKHGTVSSFVNVWECEVSGGTLGTDASRSSDSTASPGSGNTKVVVAPGTTTWAKRLTVDMLDVTGAGSLSSEQFGQFLWLLRAKVTGGTWDVQLRWGYSAWDDDSFIRGRTIEMTSTNWDFYEAGVQSVPIRDTHVFPLSLLAEAFDTGYAIQVWARRRVAGGNLDLDCVCPIPVDEGFVHLDAMAMVPSGYCSMGYGPEGKVGTIGYGSSGFPRPNAYHFYLPVGDGRMIIAYARSDRSTFADQIRMGISTDAGGYYPRWRVLRGAE